MVIIFLIGVLVLGMRTGWYICEIIHKKIKQQ